MPNIRDYLLWRGDLPLSASPWNAIDSLVLACLSYTNLPDDGEYRLSELPDILPSLVPRERVSPFFDQCRLLLDEASRLPRYEAIRLSGFVNTVDANRDIQFSAVTADLPDGVRFIAFRGTDHSIVGWREDFTMAFESPVPAQAAALDYLESAAASGKPLRIGGHSKGGNLACYASSHASDRTKALIERIYSFDGPGLDDVTFASEGYARIRGRIRSYIPQSSVVGLLLAYHEDYRVVKAKALSLAQHDPFTWQMEGTRFIELEEVDRASQLLNHTVHAWLTGSTREQRRLFINTLFDILEATEATTLKDLSVNHAANLAAVLRATRHTEPETLWAIAQLIGGFLKIGASALFDMLSGRSHSSQEE